MRWAGHVDVRNSYKILFRNPDRKRPYGRPNNRWEGNNEKCLKVLKK
jgi:hypothetical protein